MISSDPPDTKILDAAAQRIVQLAAPYARFSADIRRETDILVITRTWHFARGDKVSVTRKGSALSAVRAERPGSAKAPAE